MTADRAGRGGVRARRRRRGRKLPPTGEHTGQLPPPAEGERHGGGGRAGCRRQRGCWPPRRRAAPHAACPTHRNSPEGPRAVRHPLTGVCDLKSHAIASPGGAMTPHLARRGGKDKRGLGRGHATVSRWRLSGAQAGQRRPPPFQAPSPALPRPLASPPADSAADRPPPLPSLATSPAPLPQTPLLAASPFFVPPAIVDSIRLHPPPPPPPL